MKTISEEKRETPVVKEVDVTIIGGGLAGVSACIASAREGVSTLLIERDCFLGGVATAGLMSSMTNFFFTLDGKQVVKGIAEEILERLIELGGASPRWKKRAIPQLPYDPEIMKLVLIELLEDSGAEVLLDTLVVDTLTEENRVSGVIVENKSGRQAILSEIIVDTSGDADVVFQAGAPFNYKAPGMATLMFRLGGVDLQKTYEYFKNHSQEWREKQDIVTSFKDFEETWLKSGIFHLPHGGGRHYQLIQKAIQRGDYVRDKGLCKGLDAFGLFGLAKNNTVLVNTGFFFGDNLSVQENSKAELLGRKYAFFVTEFLRKHVPGFENSFIISTAERLGVRSTRWIKGEYVLSPKDVEKGNKFPDVVGTVPAYTIKYEKPGEELGEMDPVTFWTSYHVFYPYYHDIPYRCLLPQKIDNLLVGSGKSISSARRGLLRTEVQCMVLGQAAGTAGALSAEDKVSPKRLNINKLQSALLKQGVYLGGKNRLRELNLL